MTQNIDFDEVTHTYRLDGEVIPSVTQVMKPLSDAEYTDIDSDILDKAAKRGTMVHQAIENYLNYGFEDIPPSYRGYFDAFLLFQQEHPFDIVGVELKTYHNILRYAGTVDLLCRMGDKLVLIDYKTTSKIKEGLTSIQLEAYSAALASHDIQVDDKAILLLGKDGKYKLKMYGKHNSESIAVFGACLTIYNHIRKFKEV